MHVHKGSGGTTGMTVTRSVVLFVLAGLCEIGGGWLMWQWLRGGRPAGWGVAGAAVLVLYGIVPTLQPASFGRKPGTPLLRITRIPGYRWRNASGPGRAWACAGNRV